MRNTYIILLFLFIACKKHLKTTDSKVVSIANGQMPAIAKDDEQNIHLVYGSGDSLMYTLSNDHASSFSIPQLIDTLEGLVAYATRGPQVTATKNGLAMIAVNKTGNIFCYIRDQSGKWIKTGKVNDADSTNKEGFLGISSDRKNNLFAIWPDLRNDKRNKIYGARSKDGGKPGIKIF